MAGFDPYSAVSSVVGGAIGGIGANNAAKRQQAALNEAKRAQRSNLLMGMQLNEPARSIGYQAYGDIANQFGYSQPGYTTQNQLMATMNPLTGKQVAKMVKQGMSPDQIGSMGTLTGLTPKSIKRLTKAGLSMDQIQVLATRQPNEPQQQQGGGSNSASGTAFIDSPDYQFRLNEGQRGIGNSFAARGGAASGNALRALSEFNQNTAAGEFGNWFNRRMQLSGRGDQANQNIQSGGQNYTNAFTQNREQYGDARASGVLGVAGAVQGGLSGIAGSFGGSGNSGGYGGYGGGGFNPYPGTPPFAPGSWDAMNNSQRNWLPGSY